MTRICYHCFHQWATDAPACPACGNLRAADLRAALTLYGAQLERRPPPCEPRYADGAELGVDKRRVF